VARMVVIRRFGVSGPESVHLEGPVSSWARFIARRTLKRLLRVWTWTA
jgi:hypothetical protein